MRKSLTALSAFILPGLLVGCSYFESGSEEASRRDQDTQEPPEAQLELDNDPVDQIENLNEIFEELSPEDDTSQAGTSDEPVLQLDAPLPPSQSKAQSSTKQVPMSAKAPTTNRKEEFVYEINYATPKGTTALMVRFDLAGQVIKAVALEGNPNHSTSLQYQQALEAELGNLVVGKTVESVSAVPSKVAGSSLTPTAFNQALARLQAEA